MNAYMKQLYEDSAADWRQSALFYRAAAHAAVEISDFRYVCFAQFRALCCELYAEEAERNAQEVK